MNSFCWVIFNFWQYSKVPDSSKLIVLLSDRILSDDGEQPSLFLNSGFRALDFRLLLTIDACILFSAEVLSVESKQFY